MTSYRRWNKIPETRLQVRLVAVFLSLTAVAMMLQVFLTSRSLLALADSLPHDGELVLEQMPTLLFSSLGWSALFVLPITLGFGVIVTFRIAGPVHKIKTYLTSIRDGAKLTHCELRERDELHDLCVSLNEALETVASRSSQQATDTTAPADEPEPQVSAASPDGESGFAIVVAVTTMAMLAIVLLTAATQLVDQSKNAETAGEDRRLTLAGESAAEVGIHAIWAGYRAQVGLGTFSEDVTGLRGYLDTIGVADLTANPTGVAADLGARAGLDLGSVGALEIDGVRVLDLEAERRDLGLRTEILVRTRVAGRLRALAQSANQGWTRVIETQFDVAPERFDGLDFALLANNINCILCHTTVDSAARFYNLDASQYGTFDRVRVGTIEHLGMRGSANSTIYGALYAFGPVTDDKGAPITDWAGHSLKSVAMASGKIAETGLGAVTEADLVPDDGSNPGANLYPSYGRTGLPTADGTLPTLFPPPFPDDGGIDAATGAKLTAGADNRVTDRSEFDAVTRRFTGSIAGGRIYVIGPGGQISSQADLDAALGVSNTVALPSVVEGQVFLTGLPGNPLLIDGDVGVWGDVVLRGLVRGEGALYVSGNVYAPVDVRYQDHVTAGKRTFGEADDGLSNLLAVTAGGSIFLGDPFHPRGGSGTLKNLPSGKIGFTLVEIGLFNRSEWVKTQALLPGSGQTIADAPASWTVTNPLYAGPAYIARYYGFTANDAVPIANRGGYFDSEGTWQGKEHESVWVNMTLADPTDPTDPILFDGAGSPKAVIKLLTAGNTWITDALLKQLVDDSFTGRPEGPLQIDMFSYSANAIFGIVSSSSKNTGGKLEINGGIVAADVGLLATKGLALRYDDRARDLLSIAGDERVVLSKIAARILR